MGQFAPKKPSVPPPAPGSNGLCLRTRSLSNLAEEVVLHFTSPVQVADMLAMSSKLRWEYKKALQVSHQAMLPSYNHTLPSGQETGCYLALDVGGSTLRVALVELGGRSHKAPGLKIRRMRVSCIGEAIRGLEGSHFFDWMATEIGTMLAEDPLVLSTHQGAIRSGLAWSFPIEQTSLRGGKIQGMGKGFSCSSSVVGQDLGLLLETACGRRGLNLRVEAIVNDSTATLLCRAYSEPSTSMSLILGTGTNMAVNLPVSCISAAKFGSRDESWYAKASNVIVNTEVSMFGQNILPRTRWDDCLNGMHKLPDYQPLEYMTTGLYLGEILRLVILEAVEMAGLFDGNLPQPLQVPYSLNTSILAMLEEDRSVNMSQSAALLEKTWSLPAPPSDSELVFLRTVTGAISSRATAYLAVAIHSLFILQRETKVTPEILRGTSRTSIACNGSVIAKYPNFKERCEEFIDLMIKTDASDIEGYEEVFDKVVLETVDEGAVLGAAVAVALSE